MLTICFQAIGLNLVTVLDHLRVKQVVGLGDGAGANIILRFAMNHPSRVHGVLVINIEGVGSGGYKEIIMVNIDNRLSYFLSFNSQDKLAGRTVRTGEELNTK